MSFSEPRFLHQVVAKTEDGILKALDLTAVESQDPRWRNAEAWRCHFHVPIWWKGSNHIETTWSDWQETIKAVEQLDENPHLEIETYTWDVIPQDERSLMADGVLTTSIVSEYRALLDLLKARV